MYGTSYDYLKHQHWPINQPFPAPLSSQSKYVQGGVWAFSASLHIDVKVYLLDGVDPMILKVSDIIVTCK